MPSVSHKVLVHDVLTQTRCQNDARMKMSPILSTDFAPVSKIHLKIAIIITGGTILSRQQNDDDGQTAQVRRLISTFIVQIN